MQKIASGLKFLRSAVPVAARHQHYPVCSRGACMQKMSFARDKSARKSFPWEHQISDPTCGSKAFAQLLIRQDGRRGRDVASWRLSAARKGRSWEQGKISDPVSRESTPLPGLC